MEEVFAISSDLLEYAKRVSAFRLEDAFWESLLDKYKRIRITVHGDVELTRLETLIVDTEAFQRLRKIRQLGFVYYVYPSASHTRFEHSLGTLFVANLILEAVERNCEKINSMLRELSAGSEQKMIAYSPMPREKVLTRLVALMHDMAHIPHGHELEKEGRIFERTQWLDEDRIEVVFNDGGVGPKIVDFLEISLKEYLNNLQSNVNSSDLNVKKVAQNFLEELIRTLVAIEGGYVKNISIDHEGFVKKINVDDLSSEDDAIKKLSERNKGHSFIGDIVGNTICADLIDYIYRDFYHTGIEVRDPPYKLRLIKHFIIVGEPNNYNGARLALLVTNEKGRLRLDSISAIQQLLYDRYVLAERVYYHRVKLTFSAMFISAFSAYYKYLREKNKSVKTLIRELMKIGDEKLEELLTMQNCKLMESEEGRVISKLMESIRKRIPYKRIYMVFLSELDERDVKEIIDTYTNPIMRYALERAIEKFTGLIPGEVVVYVAKRDPGKTLLTKCLYKDIIVALKDLTIGREVHMKTEAENLTRRYNMLWRLYVFVDSKVYENVEKRECIEGLCRYFFFNRNDISDLELKLTVPSEKRSALSPARVVMRNYPINSTKKYINMISGGTVNEIDKEVMRRVQHRRTFNNYKELKGWVDNTIRVTCQLCKDALKHAES